MELISVAACYKAFYCARGDMENRIKERQLDLFMRQNLDNCTTCQELNRMMLLNTIVFFACEMRDLKHHLS